MTEPVALGTFARPDDGGEVRLTIERSQDGRRAIIARLWRRNPSGQMEPTRFGLSIRPREVRAWIASLEKASGVLDDDWQLPVDGRSLSPRDRMTRFLQDVGAASEVARS